MKLERTALLLCNGDPPPRTLARHCAARVGRVIAADGGANRARQLGVTPDTIIGDLDSISPAARRAFAGSVVIRLRRQDNTDMEKALDLLCAEGIRKTVILGLTGGRVDFTLANVISLWRYAARMEIVAAGEGWFAIPVHRPRALRLPHGTMVSFIPLGRCRGVTLSGFAYPLRHAVVRTGEMGVSNVVRSATCTVRVDHGASFLFIHRDLRKMPGLWPQ